jgi:hypothetical protein
MKEGTYRIKLAVNVTVFGEVLSLSDFMYLNYTFPDILPEITVNNVNNYIRRISLEAEEEGNSLVVISTQGTRDPAEDLVNFSFSSTTKTMSCETSSDWTEVDVLKTLETENIIGSSTFCSNLIPTGLIFCFD